MIDLMFFILFFFGAIGYYIWFWKKNKLLLLIIATNSQIAAFKILKDFVPDNLKYMFRAVTLILGLGIVIIMHYRCMKIIKKEINDLKN